MLPGPCTRTGASLSRLDHGAGGPENPSRLQDSFASLPRTNIYVRLDCEYSCYSRAECLFRIRPDMGNNRHNAGLPDAAGGPMSAHAPPWRPVLLGRSNRPVSRCGGYRRREAVLTGSGAGHNQSRVSRVRRSAALALMLALPGAGCQTGARSPGSDGSVSTSAPAATASVPTPAGWNVLCFLRSAS
jgi:hypothetical protein